MRTNSDGLWVLCDDWAIGTDPRNWILFRHVRSRKDPSKYTEWKARGYYSNPGQLFEALLNVYLMQSEFPENAIQHIQDCQNRVSEMAARFTLILKAEGLFDVKLPRRPSDVPPETF